MFFNKAPSAVSSFTRLTLQKMVFIVACLSLVGVSGVLAQATGGSGSTAPISLTFDFTNPSLASQLSTFTRQGVTVLYGGPQPLETPCNSNNPSSDLPCSVAPYAYVQTAPDGGFLTFAFNGFLATQIQITYYYSTYNSPPEQPDNKFTFNPIFESSTGNMNDLAARQMAHKRP